MNTQIGPLDAAHQKLREMEQNAEGDLFIIGYLIPQLVLVNESLLQDEAIEQEQAFDALLTTLRASCRQDKLSGDDCLAVEQLVLTLRRKCAPISV